MKGMEGRRLESVMIDLGERESGSERGERGGGGGGEERRARERETEVETVHTTRGGRAE